MYIKFNNIKCVDVDAEHYVLYVCEHNSNTYYIWVASYVKLYCKLALHYLESDEFKQFPNELTIAQMLNLILDNMGNNEKN